jgi:hypothetical protein
MELVIYPHDDPVFPKRCTDARVLTCDPAKSEGALGTFSWSKTLGQASGQWTAVIKANVANDRHIRPLAGDVLGGDWADLTMIRDGVRFPICRGVIDSCRRQRSTSGGATITNYLFTGRDHGAAFEMPLAWTNIWVQTLGEITAGLLTEKVKGKIGGSPSDLFKILIAAAFSQGTRGIPWVLPSALGKTTTKYGLGDALKVKTSATIGAYYNEMQLWTNAGQNLHSTLMGWCNPLLNELIYDLEPWSPSTKTEMWATIRQRPYVDYEQGLSSPWFDLPLWSIPTWLVGQDDIGRSNHERFNLIELLADFGWLASGEQTAFTPPHVDRDGLQKYGLLPLLENTKHIAGGMYGGWEDERERQQQMLVDWHSPNAYWLSGTKQIGTALPEIRIGDRVKFTRDDDQDEHYYVEGVNCNWSFGAAGVASGTGLTLTRGYIGDEYAVLDLIKTARRQWAPVFTSAEYATQGAK